MLDKSTSHAHQVIDSVKQGQQFLAGILPEDQHNLIPPPIPNDLPPDQDQNMDKLQGQFLPHDNPHFFLEHNPGRQDPVVGNQAVEAFITQHRGYCYAKEHDQFCQHWEAIENRITAACLECQTRTLNWTRKSCYLNTCNNACNNCTWPQLPVQLVYQGYLLASPQQPRTTFSIPLLQAYHNVWQTLVSVASSPFTSTTHLYSHITVITKSVLQHGLQLTMANLWAERCSRCFGPAKDELKESDEEADVITLLDTFPHLQVGILYDIGCHLDKHIKTRNQLHTADWLHRQMESTKSTIKATQEVLNTWLAIANPNNPNELYTLKFFEAQWHSKRHHNIMTSKDIKIRQKITLGQLLCLEDHLATQIAAQQAKVGTMDTLSNLSQAGQDCFLKLWFAKTEVCTCFLALRAEQRTLDPENRVGGSSRLGQ
ncbi:hypothetical protein DFH28DRAFT_1077376 [Melampsora americana]|nr:hypothetical protein DFH28DRAFT_1077376 [Melampsora americana]